MKAIVLAAGKGTRLLPLTEQRPKHLLEIAGKPILKRILDQLINSASIDEIGIVVNYCADQIIAKVDEWYPDFNFQFIHQQSLDGTGDAVDQALAQVKVSSDFAVVNGDVLLGDPFESMIQDFQNSQSHQGLIAGAQVPDPQAFGVLTQEEDTLKGIVEKPDQEVSGNLINAGFYIFPFSAVPLFQELKKSRRGERELTEVLDQLITKGAKIKVYPCTKGWFDVGHPWQVLDANSYFMQQEQESYQLLGSIEKNVEINGKVHLAKTAKLRSGVYIEGPVFIDEHADIGPNCYIRGSSYIGRAVRIGNACEIKNSVIYQDTHAAHLSYVGDSVLGASCNLGAGTITANLRHDGNNVKMTIKDKRIDTGRRKVGVIMGDGVKTGIGVNILPGVKISANTWINAGETLSRDC